MYFSTFYRKILLILTGLLTGSLHSANALAAKTDSLEALLMYHPTDTSRVNLLLDLCSEWKSVAPEKALKTGHEALNLSRTLNYEKGSGQALLSIGEIHYYTANYPEALYYFFESVKVYEALNYPKGIGAAQNNIGTVYYAAGKYNTALSYYKQAEHNYELGKDTIGLARARNNIGNLFFQREDYPHALKYYHSSLALKKAMGDHEGSAMSYNNLGNVYGEKGDYVTSRNYFRKALRIFEEAGDSYGAAMTLNNIGILYSLEGDSAKAIQHTRKGLEYAHSVNASELRQDAYESLAEIYREFGDYKKAYEYFRHFAALKDTLLNEENQKNLNELKARYDTEKKEQQLVLNQAELDRQRTFNAWLMGFIGLGTLLAIVLIVAYLDKKRTNRKLSDQKKLIETKNSELSEKNRNITDSLEYASRIQQAMLPPERFFRRIFPESFVFYRPKDIVSGDFYWLETRGDQIMVAVADCTGHGVPGAFMSVAGHNLLMETVNVHGITEPAEVLGEISKGLARLLYQERGETDVKDGMDISLCRIDVNRKKLHYAGAFSNLWIVRHEKLIEIPGNKFSIGSFLRAGTSGFTSHEISLETGDNLYLFSDGFADQFGGKQGKKFKPVQLRNLLISIHHLDMEKQYRELEKHFDAWKGDYDQVDDVCLVGIRI